VGHSSFHDGPPCMLLCDDFYPVCFCSDGKNCYLFHGKLIAQWVAQNARRRRRRRRMSPKTCIWLKRDVGFVKNTCFIPSFAICFLFKHFPLNRSLLSSFNGVTLCLLHPSLPPSLFPLLFICSSHVNDRKLLHIT
jgi:hypothetical protein